MTRIGLEQRFRINVGYFNLISILCFLGTLRECLSLTPTLPCPSTSSAGRCLITQHTFFTQETQLTPKWFTLEVRNCIQTIQPGPASSLRSSQLNSEPTWMNPTHWISLNKLWFRSFSQELQKDTGLLVTRKWFVIRHYYHQVPMFSHYNLSISISCAKWIQLFH